VQQATLSSSYSVGIRGLGDKEDLPVLIGLGTRADLGLIESSTKLISHLPHSRGDPRGRIGNGNTLSLIADKAREEGGAL